MTTFEQAITKIQEFQSGSLKQRLLSLEDSLKGKDKTVCDSLLSQQVIDVNLLNAALTIKQVAGQINEIVHAVGILLLLPKILNSGETIEYLSLGAGNTGKDFDLETDGRVAEFKFIQWRGGTETVRQNKLFEGFCKLVECDKDKDRYLYVVDTEYPLKFLGGGRAIGGTSGALSKNQTLSKVLAEKYGETEFGTVRDYYQRNKALVHLVGLSEIASDLVPLFRLLDAQIQDVDE